MCEISLNKDKKEIKGIIYKEKFYINLNFFYYE